MFDIKFLISRHLIRLRIFKPDIKIVPMQSLNYYVTTIYMSPMDPSIEKPVKIALEDGAEFICDCTAHTIRSGKDMKGYFLKVPEPDLTIYEIYELKPTGHIALAVTKIPPGKVGDEYFMTKGHFHEDDLAGEIYFGLKGKGLLILQSKDGQTEELELTPGVSISIPPKWAHRSVNVGGGDFVFLAAYPVSAGHDYGSIEKKGFVKRVIEIDGIPQVV
jgi:glucose-6-phosphate isomerase